MKVTVTTLRDDMFTLEISEDTELEMFKTLCEFECHVKASQMNLTFNGIPMDDGKKRLRDYDVTDGDVILLHPLEAAPAPQAARASEGGLPGSLDFSSIQVPGTSASTSRAPAAATAASGGAGGSEDPATIREMLLNSPHDLAILKERNPPLADALLNGNLEKFTEVLRKQQSERTDRERERIRMLNADPFDAAVQQKIAEEIRLKNVESNMETAMEFSPESFGQVVMLYVDCKVNGHDVKAFVDSGAQMTIMSQACAERCNIMRLVDSRWAGIAKGVGTQKIIGRVHLCQIQIGPDFLQSSFSILEQQPMDMLLGLDMLKRHQCLIDLKSNKLVIGTTGTETPFLSEGELPEHARLNRQQSGSEGDEDRQLAEALAKSSEESAATDATASAPSTAANFPEADILKLTEFGFSRQQAIHELARAEGNIDQALAALFAKSFQVPS